MTEQSTNKADRLDHLTSKSICRAIGEKLGCAFSESSDLPPRLQSLLAALHVQEDQSNSDGVGTSLGSPTAAG
jgi:hypothetical protein